MAEYYRLYQPSWPVPEDPVCLARVLAYTALAHDFGKIHQAFQAALRQNGPPFRNRHEVLSLLFLSYLDIPANERPWVEAAIALHHKNLFRLVGANQPFYLSPAFGRDGTAAKRLAGGVEEMPICCVICSITQTRFFMRLDGQSLLAMKSARSKRSTRWGACAKALSASSACDNGSERRLTILAGLQSHCLGRFAAPEWPRADSS
jgi:CRISPR-associated endonuclease Cas3-HD